ncbi:uncharacterized protein LOC131302422 isoform X1 [Rhododendron vialii]|uniref:uncharacterized protein LOC131302422 isoform X1 n=1 Tax=Rhododendron vialii TaxID=182163 RepID=UPI00265EE128|nr:uncharacterized protein LOC131302422 isoform X1 [Rhododendron vialii]XP_058185050.1 uncharacterized protein LOC131302422 isoform X1 [Rhododendron vialii]XP_058185051.1 uncharacterized protein LOC131302422 isoform X1 [Rhododendron vialii]XP_058185052.1 uncharacterized protein LOC131302422 isoform X1 [Rhododendron vialii]
MDGRAFVWEFSQGNFSCGCGCYLPSVLGNLESKELLLLCGLAAFGVIARDCGRYAQVWHVGRVSVSSASSIEAWALRIACRTATEMGFSEVIFESDCQVLMNCFKEKPTPCPWELCSFVKDIKTWAHSRNWSFVCCNREKNRAAHEFASYCLSRNFVPKSGCILAALQSLVDSDVIR